MVKEKRTLYFSNPEIMDALRLFKAQDLDLPEGTTIDTLTLKAAPDVRLTLFIDSENGGSPMQQELSAPFITAMLLRFCFHKKIPLPRNARKDIDVIDGELVMSLSI